MATKTKISFGMKLLLAFCVFFVGFGLYHSIKGSGGKNNATGGKNNSSQFCGKTFNSEDYQREMDMQKKYVTILNCDGSYTSELNWNAYSPSGEEVYNNTVGTSRGQFKNFSGSWEIATANIPEHIARQIAEYEDFEPNHMPKGQTTIIKYRSNEGRSGYAYIYTSNDKDETILTPVPSAMEVSTSYDDDDLDMYFGRFQN